MDDLIWLEPDEFRVFGAFARSSRRMFVQLDRELERDLKMPRAYFEILWLLHHAPGESLRMSELAEMTGSQPSRITHAVSRLELEGQVRRELCREDRRGFFCVLTPKGLDALRAATPRYARSIREHLLAPLSIEQREQLASIGEAVMAHFAEFDAESTVPATTPAPKDAPLRRSPRGEGRAPIAHHRRGVER